MNIEPKITTPIDKIYTRYMDTKDTPIKIAIRNTIPTDLNNDENIYVLLSWFWCVSIKRVNTRLC